MKTSIIFILSLLLLLLHSTTLSKADAGFNFFPNFFGSNNDRFGPQNNDLPDKPVAYYDAEGGGQWELFQENGGVSAMHLVINHLNKAIYFDASIYVPAKMQLPEGTQCNPIPGAKNGEVDCWAHAAEMDIYTGEVRPLKMLTDTWCSSGGFGPDGTFISTGGWKDGGRAVRYMGACENCDFLEFPTSLTGERWYSTNVPLPDGAFVVIGGRGMFSFEYVPPPGTDNTVNIPLPFLQETNDKVENNLYPFAYLSPDGKIFLFANNRAILFDPKTGRVVHKYPALEGGSRNYPASGMSALLPIDLNKFGKHGPVQAEVLICGGATPDAFDLAPKKVFPDALRTCGRISITDPTDEWHMEEMPMPRTMGDMIVLPNTEVLIINGARKGCAGWDFARDPVLEPVLYRPYLDRGDRFSTLKPSEIPRMYHSTTALLPDGVILVAGSNTNPRYQFEDALFRTEVRVEKFYPPYLETDLMGRPTIVEYTVPNVLRYGEEFDMQFGLLRFGAVDEEDVMVTLYAPPFTTHGFSQSQRLLVLRTEDVGMVFGMRVQATVQMPQSAVLAPPGYYMLFAVYRGVPSTAVWVKLQA